MTVVNYSILSIFAKTDRHNLVHLTIVWVNTSTFFIQEKCFRKMKMSQSKSSFNFLETLITKIAYIKISILDAGI